MKKNLMFFALGVSTALLMGAGMSYWNEIQQSNKYGVLIDKLGGTDGVPIDNRYGVLVNAFSCLERNDVGMPRRVGAPIDNRYGVLVNTFSSIEDVTADLKQERVPIDNRYGVLINKFSTLELNDAHRMDKEIVPIDNRHVLIWDREIGDNAREAMVVGFIHGLAVGKKKAKGGAKN